MIYSRVFLILLSLFVSQRLFGQEKFLVKMRGIKCFERSGLLPPDITSSRSAIIVSVPDKEGIFPIREDWKSLAVTAHKTFRKIGIDAISYLNIADFNSGPEVQVAYQKIFASRKVKNLIYLEEEGTSPNEQITLMVIPLNTEGIMVNGQLVWKETAPDMESISLQLGRQVLRQNLERSNFLIPEGPEYLDDMIIFNGTKLENFPSRLRSLPLAVVGFKKVSIDNITDPGLEQQVIAYNLEIDRKNQELVDIMSIYPFKYEVVTETNEEMLKQRGFQYSMMPIESTGKFIKKVLNFQITPSETDYMTSIFDETGTQKLMKIPVDANVCKYYIKQTIVHDIHTGDDWDTGLTWQESLRNFLLHMRAAFNLPIGE